MDTIIISAIISLIISLLVHLLTITQVTKWFDKFFEEESRAFKKYAKDIEKIVKEKF